MTLAHALLPALALACIWPAISAAQALLLGAALALTFGNPYAARTKALSSRLLMIAVVGLGAGMNLETVARAGLQGIGYTVVSISLSLALGLLLARLLKVEGQTGLLIAVGTAICGGSAIAAVAPAVRAKEHEVSVSLGTVFMLNALALFVFPPAGHALGLSETQFGLWSALAIHDTSSVVGASQMYGPEALQIGTTVKLARALWIVPITFIIGSWVNRGQKGQTQAKAKRPWFILGFLLVAALVTYIPALQPAGHLVEWAARRALVVTLFLIGASLTRATLAAVGFRPFAQGILLWIIVAGTTLGALLTGWVH